MPPSPLRCRHHIRRPTYTCTLSLQGASVYMSTLTLTCIAVDRYAAVVHPYRPRMRNATAVGLALAVNFVALLCTAPYFFHMGVSKVGCLYSVPFQVGIHETPTCGIRIICFDCQRNSFQGLPILLTALRAFIPFLFPPLSSEGVSRGFLKFLANITQPPPRPVVNALMNHFGCTRLEDVGWPKCFNNS